MSLSMMISEATDHAATYTTQPNNDSIMNMVSSEILFMFFTWLNADNLAVVLCVCSQWRDLVHSSAILLQRLLRRSSLHIQHMRNTNRVQAQLVTYRRLTHLTLQGPFVFHLRHNATFGGGDDDDENRNMDSSNKTVNDVLSMRRRRWSDRMANIPQSIINIDTFLADLKHQLVNTATHSARVVINTIQHSSPDQFGRNASGTLFVDTSLSGGNVGYVLCSCWFEI